MRNPKTQPLAMLARAICILVLAGLSLDGGFLWAVTPLKTIAVGHAPGPIAVDPSAHLAYVLNEGSGTVSVIDTLQLKVKKMISVGGLPVGIAANPSGGMVYIANSGSGTISMISGIKAAVSWPVGGKPGALVVDSALNQLYVMDVSRNQIEILDAAKGTVLATLPTVLQPTAMALNLATHALFVACVGASGSVIVIDGTHNQILTTVGSLPAGTTSISVDPSTNVAVLASPTANTYTVVNAANGYSVLVQPGNSGADPIATAYDPGGDTFFAADNGDNEIYFADGTGVVHLGNDYAPDLIGATALAVNPSTNQMVVLYGGTDAAYLLDLLNPLFPQNYHSLTAGLYVAGAAFDPLTSRLFITNSSDNTLSVFDVSPSAAYVPAFEHNFNGFGDQANYIDTNPATGTTYTLRLGDLFAINEAQAAGGDNGNGGDSAGVTTILLATINSTCVAVNSASNKIYVGDGQGFFYSVSGATNVATLIGSVPASADIQSLAVDSASNEILAWDNQNQSLYVLDSGTDTVLKTIPLGFSSEQAPVLVDPAKDLAFVVSKSVFVVDPGAGSVVATIPLTGQPIAAAMNPASSRLYTVDNSGNLYVIDTTKNSIVTSFKVQYSPSSIGVNPVTGNYYVGVDDGGTGTIHIFVYSGSNNTLLMDLSRAVYPEIAGATDIKSNPLTNKVYVGSDNGNSTAAVAVIDGLTGTVSALAPSPFDYIAYALAVDLGSGVVAGAGTSYTTLWFPSTSTGLAPVPIAVAMGGVKDSSTIATVPVFRTHNTKPKFTISATSNFAQNAAALVPTDGFYQVDGWQGTWKAVTLKAKVGSLTSSAKVTLPTLSTGRHILYAYATDGDMATVQASGTGVNSPVISPTASVVFTVEK